MKKNHQKERNTCGRWCASGTSVHGVLWRAFIHRNRTKRARTLKLQIQELSQILHIKVNLWVKKTTQGRIFITYHGYSPSLSWWLVQTRWLWGNYLKSTVWVLKLTAGIKAGLVGWPLEQKRSGSIFVLYALHFVMVITRVSTCTVKWDFSLAKS